MISTTRTTDQTVTPITRRSRSHATRAADQNTAPTTEQITAALTAAGVSEAEQAKMLKSIAPKPPKMNVKHVIYAELVRVAADLAESWNPDEHDGIPREVATEVISRRMSYTPGSAWDARLGERRMPKSKSDADADAGTD